MSERFALARQARKRRIALALLVVVVLGALSALAFYLKPPAFHPYVVLQATEHFELTFLQRALPERGACERAAQRVAQAVTKACALCRVVESRCLDGLDPIQRKLLHGRPVDVPVMRVPNGVISFRGSQIEHAVQVCQKASLARGSVSNRRECELPGLTGLALSMAEIARPARPATFGQLELLVWIPLVAMVAALFGCWLIIRSDPLHGRFTQDRIDGGPQKFHASPVPRIGGVALAVALGFSIIAAGRFGWVEAEAADGLYMLMLAGIPAFAGGLAEDVTRRFGVLARLMLTISAGVIASLLVGATLDRVDVPGLDLLLQWPVLAIAFTAVAVGGVANAVNIIDGYHGLVGGYAVLVLAALAFVSMQVGDPVVLTASLAMTGALVGFLFWNYPGGRIFLGDGGAYLLGFWLAELAVLLVVRNPEVSPWFPMVLLAYPVFETLFSIYRRNILQGKSSGRPDALHLHQLIYLRLARTGAGSHDPNEITRRNSKVACYVWIGTAAFAVPAMFLWRDTPALIAASLIFSTGYVWLYVRLARRRAPGWTTIDSRHRSR
jgi:UDP-GlcNAc:undecaprenyl-phosphate/decaprenyl-phosphate GlcNAc-1-phosphate transferase